MDFDTNCQDSIEDLHPYVPDSITLSEFTIRVIVYIAGFVIRHLKKSLHCEPCIEALTGNKSHVECSLINIKNCGSLSYPSHDNNL